MLTIGLIGAGAVAKSHLLALSNIEDIRVTAISDPIVERARGLVEPLGQEAYEDHRDVLERVEAVWICTPPEVRRGPVVNAVMSGRHLVLDKPLATTMAVGQAMVDAVEASGVIAIVNFSQRYSWSGRTMRDRVTSGFAPIPWRRIGFWRRRMSCYPSLLRPFIQIPARSPGTSGSPTGPTWNVTGRLVGQAPL